MKLPYLFFRELEYDLREKEDYDVIGMPKQDKQQKRFKA
jgi:hypothetical protein